jgi:sterol desaturase/sphingolipid hydroxylase (fatty acid hydroxylase superfamily)
MILLIVVAWVLSIIQKNGCYNSLDTIYATSIGLVNVCVSALLKIEIFGIILFFCNVIKWSIPSEWWAYILCIIVIDFCRYGSHILTHVNRFWWATDITHHNSDKYNLSVAFYSMPFIIFLS